MAAKINTIIPAQSFEIIRDKIALILKEELLNQATLAANPKLNAIVYVERYSPPNSSEVTDVPIVNVLLGQGDYSNQDVTQSTGTYLYFIDVYTKAKANDDKGGDERAIISLQKILGICRGILEATQYLTLGFTAPFVMGRKINSIQIAGPSDPGADSLVRGRLILQVMAPEYQELSTANILDGTDTTVRIEESPQGYLWVVDSY